MGRQSRERWSVDEGVGDEAGLLRPCLISGLVTDAVLLISRAALSHLRVAPLRVMKSVGCNISAALVTYRLSANRVAEFSLGNRNGRKQWRWETYKSNQVVRRSEQPSGI